MTGRSFDLALTWRGPRIDLMQTSRRPGVDLKLTIVGTSMAEPGAVGYGKPRTRQRGREPARGTALHGLR